jgi:uncharacterized membrane protein
MMWRLAFLLLWLGAGLAQAQDYPALHAVTGVAADDVLNIRERPDAGSPILGALAPDATGIEVVSVSDGWALVNLEDSSGYAAVKYLARETAPDWNTLERPLTCLGTEPFWSLDIDPDAGTVTFSTPEMPAQDVPITVTWPGAPWARSAALQLPDGIAVLSPAECSDGMSERSYGIAADLFLNGPDRLRLSGCCQLAAP